MSKKIIISASDDVILKLKVLATEKEDVLIATLNVLEDLQVEREKLVEAKAKGEFLIKDLEKFRLAVDNVSDQIIITDSDATVLYINKATEKITGYTAEEAVGGKAGKLWGNLMEKSFYEDLWKTIKIDKKTFISEIMNQRKNNQTYTARISISPILDKKGAVEFFVGIEHDISKEKEIEKTRTDFLILASHQLRTPLSGTKWLIETMQRRVLGPVTPKQKEYLDQIYQINERMIKLVFSMLSVLQFEAGATLVKKEVISVPDLYEEVALMSRSAAHNSGVLLRNALKDHKTIMMETDITMLRSILETFVSNAINYSQRGQEIILDVKEEESAVVFFVKDSGIGIPKEEQKRIFQRFYRASNAKPVKPDGTGLGLYIASMLAEKIGAKISFESEENKGSTFYLRVSKKINI